MSERQWSTQPSVYLSPIFGRASRDRTVSETMADADASAEYTDIYDGKHVRVSRSFAWLAWEFGVGVAHLPYDKDEPWGIWLNLGPLTLCIDFKPTTRSGPDAGATQKGER